MVKISKVGHFINSMYEKCLVNFIPLQHIPQFIKYDIGKFLDSSFITKKCEVVCVKNVLSYQEFHLIVLTVGEMLFYEYLRRDHNGETVPFAFHKEDLKR